MSLNFEWLPQSFEDSEVCFFCLKIEFSHNFNPRRNLLTACQIVFFSIPLINLASIGTNDPSRHAGWDIHARNLSYFETSSSEFELVTINRVYLANNKRVNAA